MEEALEVVWLLGGFWGLVSCTHSSLMLQTCGPWSSLLAMNACVWLSSRTYLFELSWRVLGVLHADTVPSMPRAFPSARTIIITSHSIPSTHPRFFAHPKFSSHKRGQTNIHIYLCLYLHPYDSYLAPWTTLPAFG